MLEASRWAIGIAWILAGGIACVRLRRRRGGPWLLLLGLLDGSAAALRWHVAVYATARGWLRTAGVYEQRAWFKLVLAAALLAVAVALIASLRRPLRHLPRRLRASALAMIAWALYLAAYTMFLDDVLPAALGQWPWRQLLEAAFAATALLAAALPGGAHAG